MDEYQKPGGHEDIMTGQWKSVSGDAPRKSARPNREVKKVGSSSSSSSSKKSARPEHLSAKTTSQSGGASRRSSSSKGKGSSRREEKATVRPTREKKQVGEMGAAALKGAGNAVSALGRGVAQVGKGAAGLAAGAASGLKRFSLKNGPLKDTRYGQDAEFRRRIIMSGVGALCVFSICLIGTIAGGSGEGRTSSSQEAVSENNTVEAEPVEAEAPVVMDREPVSFTVSVFGDCTLGTDEYFDWDSSLNNYYDMYGADYFLENVRDILEADDLTIANLEGALTYAEEREDKTFAFKGEPEYVRILSDSGVECANTANNHSHDYGEESYQDTLDAMDQYGLKHFGYDEVLTMDVKGVKVGILGIYELDDHKEREPQLRANMQKLKDAGSEVIIAIFHWGNELEEEPDENQIYLGHLAVDLGANLVCGHHPHVLQGIEVYKGVNIFYSLGNFCFGGNTHPYDFDTAIFQQTFTVDANGVKQDNVTNIIPCCVSSDWDYNNYQPTPQEGYEAERILEKIQERSDMIG